MATIAERELRRDIEDYTESLERQKKRTTKTLDGENLANIYGLRRGAWLKLAKLTGDVAMYALAQADGEQATILSPHNAKGFAELGDVYSNMGNHTDALKMCERVDACGTTGDALTDCYIANIVKRIKENAKNSRDSAVTLTPSQPVTLTPSQPVTLTPSQSVTLTPSQPVALTAPTTSTMTRREKDIRRNIDRYTEYIGKESPFDTDGQANVYHLRSRAWMELAHLLGDKTLYISSKIDCEKAIELTPDYAVYYADLGEIEMTMENYAAALQACDRAVACGSCGREIFDIHVRNVIDNIREKCLAMPTELSAVVMVPASTAVEEAPPVEKVKEDSDSSSFIFSDDE